MVFLPGLNPCFIVKTATSLPHVLGLQGSRVYSISGFHSSTCKNGFVYVDTEVSRNEYDVFSLRFRCVLLIFRGLSEYAPFLIISFSVYRGQSRKCHYRRRLIKLSTLHRLTHMSWVVTSSQSLNFHMMTSFTPNGSMKSLLLYPESILVV